MKKLYYILMFIVITISLFGCSSLGKGKEDTQAKPSVTGTIAATPTPIPLSSSLIDQLDTDETTKLELNNALTLGIVPSDIDIKGNITAKQFITL